MMRAVGLFLAVVLLAPGAAPGQFAPPVRLQFPAVAPQSDASAVLMRQGASAEERSRACAELALTAGAGDVPLLAGLLADAQLSSLACHALEVISEASAGDALRRALPKLESPQLNGVIAALGRRREPASVASLSPLLSSPDRSVAKAAAMAIGQIATAESARVLVKAMSQDASAPGLCEGLLACADAMLSAGNNEPALAIFDRLRTTTASGHVKMAAIRGAVLSRQPTGVDLLLWLFRSEDEPTFAAILRMALELPGPDVTQALCAQLRKLPPARRTMLIEALGLRGDVTAMPYLTAAAQGGDVTVRVAAIAAMPALGDPYAASLLLNLAVGSEQSAVAEAARTALISMRGTSADDALLTGVQASNPATRRLAIEVLGLRKATAAASLLAEQVDDPNPQIRLAAIVAVGRAGDAEQIPVILRAMQNARSAPAADAAIVALESLCAASRDKEATTRLVLGSLETARGTYQAGLLRALPECGTAKALEALRQTIRDGDAQSCDAATRAMCEWPTVDGAADLLRLAQIAGTEEHRLLSLQGLIRLSAQGTPEQRLAMCRQAMELVTRDAERKLVLESLSTVARPQALQMAVLCLGEPGVKEEACRAAVSLGELLASREPRLVAEAMMLVAGQASQGEIARRARLLLERTADRGR